MKSTKLNPVPSSIISRLARAEDGFSMISAITALMVGTLLSLAAWATANSDIRFTDKDRWSRLAYQRAQSGVSDYIQHLAEDSGYWTKCDRPEEVTGDGLGQTALNDKDISSSNSEHPERRWLPWATDGSADDLSFNAQYSIDLLPNSGTCKPLATASDRMIDPTTGTFRIRVTGRAGPTVPSDVAPSQIDAWRQKNWRKVSVVAEFRRTGFLDFVYFSDRESFDPALISNSSTREACDAFYQDDPGYDPALSTQAAHPGRWRQGDGGNGSNCIEIQWGNSDGVNGPFHTNDGINVASPNSDGAVFGNPGRGDRIEVYDHGYSTCPVRTRYGLRLNPPALPSLQTYCYQRVNTASAARFIYGPDAKYLDLPQDNEDLTLYADENSGDPDSAGKTFKGKTSIQLNDNGTYTVSNNPYPASNGTFAYPTSGVIYVENDGVSNCQSNPNTKYSTSIPVGCALLEVSGNYNKSLTLGSEADVVITGNIDRSNSESAVLGLVAKQYVRIRHYRRSTYDTNYGPGGSSCYRDTESPVRSPVTQVRAAVLALNKSWTVDSYGCGSDLGTLSVNGAIAQKWRGPVRNGSSGYDKDYNYDYTLKSQTPPHFLSPTAATWKVIRLRQQVPACACGKTN